MPTNTRRTNPGAIPEVTDAIHPRMLAARMRAMQYANRHALAEPPEPTDRMEARHTALPPAPAERHQPLLETSAVGTPVAVAITIAFLAYAVSVKLAGWPSNIAQTMLASWTSESWPMSALMYWLTWRTVRRYAKHSSPLRWYQHVLGSLCTALITGSVRLGVVMPLWGGRAALDALSNDFKVVVGVVVPAAAAFCLIKLMLVRMPAPVPKA